MLLPLFARREGPRRGFLGDGANGRSFLIAHSISMILCVRAPVRTFTQVRTRRHIAGQ